ncbi:hypothetical protein EVAR_94105_1 [Eumeta japonica]|uniref:(+)RNA virus helicase C-terminal domain-containing protein n=1 Tax=Eumeta variegata TaxID=151549 RepID=A0A4C1U721_EUMVA|nr:hypothetical protein EVAR_94105_1 [Eumeta japonica]
MTAQIASCTAEQGCHKNPIFSSMRHYSANIALAKNEPEHASVVKIVRDVATLVETNSREIILRVAASDSCLVVISPRYLRDAVNLFEMQYIRPNLVTTVTNELLCTYRNPMDVEYALNEGFGKGEVTRVLTIHEAQGLTSEGTIIVRIAAKRKIHAVVAITRYTVSYVYHTDDGADAIGRFIKKTVAASENKIKGINAKNSYSK